MPQNDRRKDASWSVREWVIAVLTTILAGTFMTIVGMAVEREVSDNRFIQIEERLGDHVNQPTHRENLIRMDRMEDEFERRFEEQRRQYLELKQDHRVFDEKLDRVLAHQSNGGG